MVQIDNIKQTFKAVFLQRFPKNDEIQQANLRLSKELYYLYRYIVDDFPSYLIEKSNIPASQKIKTFAKAISKLQRSEGVPKLDPLVLEEMLRM